MLAKSTEWFLIQINQHLQDRKIWFYENKVLFVFRHKVIFDINSDLITKQKVLIEWMSKGVNE